MDIERFKDQHEQILDGIAGLRRHAHAGIVAHAHDIASGVAALSRVVTLHLAIEDRILYPALRNGTNQRLADMGRAYQEDMKGIANAYIAFARRWCSASAIQAQAEQFREDANTVLKMLHARMRREDTEFYPEIEAV